MTGPRAVASDGLTVEHRPPAPAPVMLASQLRPALALAGAAAARLLAAAARHDVWLGGCFEASDSGAQVWDSPRSNPRAQLLGAVSWTRTQGAGLSVTSASVTSAGLAAGEGTLTILARVLGLTGLPVDGSQVTLAIPAQPSARDTPDAR